MLTSKEWWESVKSDTAKFNEWLVKQYRGEVTASYRINNFASKYANEISLRSLITLGIIAKQEAIHAEWVLGLLESRGIKPDISNAEERYWKETLPAIESFETGAAIGAHAEAMRLERIKVICNDNNAPEDVKKFSKEF